MAKAISSNYKLMYVPNYTRRHGKKLRQDWGGALKDFRDKYTSLELQKKAFEWRGD